MKLANLSLQKAYALNHPVYEPTEQITRGHFWQIEPDVFAGLTVNIGME